MPRSRIIAVVAVLVVVVVVATFLLGRYLTPSTQQRVIEQQATSTTQVVP